MSNGNNNATSSIEDLLRQKLEEASEVSTSLGSVKQRSISEIIEADRYLRSIDSGNRPANKLRFIKLIPPASV